VFFLSAEGWKVFSLGDSITGWFFKIPKLLLIRREKRGKSLSALQCQLIAYHKLCITSPCECDCVWATFCCIYFGVLVVYTSGLFNKVYYKCLLIVKHSTILLYLKSRSCPKTAIKTLITLVLLYFVKHPNFLHIEVTTHKSYITRALEQSFHIKLNKFMCNFLNQCYCFYGIIYIYIKYILNIY